MKTDTLVYQILKFYERAFFELIGQANEATQSPSAYKFSSLELKQQGFRLDGLFVPVVENPALPIYFVEAQFYKEETFYSRMFASIHLYFYQYSPVNEDWYAIVIYDRRSNEVPAPQLYRELMEHRVQRFYLNEIGEAAEQSLGVGIMQLIVLSKKNTGETARQLIAKAKQELPDASLQRKVIELIETIVVYKFPNSSREEIEAMLALSELKKTRVYQEAKEEGRQEGRQEGKLDGKLEMVPWLMELGLSVEQISQRLGLDAETIKQAAQPTS